MTNNVNENKLKSDIEGFVQQKGWPGFFGLLATISPKTIDQGDLEKYNAGLPSYDKVSPIEPPIQLQNFDYSNPVKAASIYAEEHIPAVQDDLKDKRLEPTTSAIEEPKAKVLAPTKSTAPNPWEEATVVMPGQLKL